MKTLFTSKTTKFLIPVILLSALTISFHSPYRVCAAESGMSVESICKPDETFYAKVLNVLKSISQETTVTGALFTQFVQGPFINITGTSLSGFMNCFGQMYETYGLDAASSGNPAMNSNLGKIAASCNNGDPEYCAELVSVYDMSGSQSTSFNTTSKESLLGGSLLGLSKSVQSATYEPIPVNMAYYFHDVGSRLPVVGDKVYAANEANYTPLIKRVNDLWKVARDISYGLMAIIMLVVGIMIITRRQVSSQVVVSIQYALPKIVIALILITFSYPIGATIATMGWTLFKNADDIVKTAFGASTGQTGILAGARYGMQQLTQGGDAGLKLGGLLIVVVMLVMVFAMVNAGVAGTVLTMAILCGLVIIVMALITYLKALVVYFKMVFMVILSPFEFVLYAIPGNDDRLGNWFKKMAANALSMFGLGALITLCNFIAISIILDAEQPFSSLLYAVFTPVVIYAYGLSVALTLPKKVEGWILGEQKKRR